MNTVSWIGTIASIVGSFLVALGFGVYGYPLFVIGSISWLYIGFAKRDTSLITLNGVFFAANIVGLYKALV